jgi:hypothetical protein
MKEAYSKTSIALPEMVRLLKSRGLLIADEQRAI